MDVEYKIGELTELPHKRQKLSEMLKSPILTTLGWFDQPMGRVDQPKYFWSGVNPVGVGAPPKIQGY